MSVVTGSCKARWLAIGVVLFGLSGSVLADDPCDEAILEAKMLLKNLRSSAGSLSGGFRVKEAKNAVGNSTLYRVEYVTDGKAIIAHNLKASDESYPIVNASVSKDGKRLQFYFHTGGSGCCKCSYEIRAGSGGFVLTRAQ